MLPQAVEKRRDMHQKLARGLLPRIWRSFSISLAFSVASVANQAFFLLLWWRPRHFPVFWRKYKYVTPCT